jgi:aminopeptidase N
LILPELYDLQIIPNIPTNFHGVVVITFSIGAPSPFAELHASDHLTILSVTQDSAPIQHQIHPPLLRIFSADFSRPVRIEFDGAFGTDTGFYTMGPTAAVTQCAAQHAREIFPCFDAPIVRSRLRLTLYAPSGTVALSNMPFERQDGSVHVFAPTPPLPTYLFAWTFGAFKCIQRTTSRGVPIEFYVPRDSENFDCVQELADAEVKIVEFEESWCGRPLPPTRLQVAFVPRFAFGAMENYV